jgi:hypothetical protein
MNDKNNFDIQEEANDKDFRMYMTYIFELKIEELKIKRNLLWLNIAVLFLVVLNLIKWVI